MTWDRIGRRQFLRGLGGFTLGLPLLPSLLPEALAQGLVGEKRFLSIWHPFGMYKALYWPNVTGQVQADPDVRIADLSQITGDLSVAFSNANFGDLKGKMNLLRGLDMTWWQGTHNRGGMLGAAWRPGGVGADLHTTANGETIDIVMARSKKIYPQGHSLPFFNVGIGFRTSISYERRNNNIVPVGHTTDVKAAFARMMNAPVIPGRAGGGGGPVLPGSLSVADQKKAVDLVMEEYKSLRQNRRISADDKLRLEDHMQFISELQAQASQAAQMQAGVAAAAPGGQCPTVQLSTGDQETLAKTMGDIIVAAFACGKTRIASLVLQHTQGLSDSDYHESISHSNDERTITDRGGGDAVGPATRNITFHARVVSHVCRKMNAITEANGKTLLDNSLVYWGSELGHANSHQVAGLPVFLAGSLGGTFRTGRYIDYRQKGASIRRTNDGGNALAVWEPIGRVYNQLLVSILMGMGLQPADYETGGQAGFGRYDFIQFDYYSKQNREHLTKYLAADVQRSYLPYLKS